jgi:hypothetical protein
MIHRQNLTVTIFLLAFVEKTFFAGSKKIFNQAQLSFLNVESYGSMLELNIISSTSQGTGYRIK